MSSQPAEVLDLSPFRKPLPDWALDILFREARSNNGWLPGAVSDAEIHRLRELIQWGPTSMNGNPARFVFIRSAEGKERLRPALPAANVDKVLQAPLTVIIGYDPEFWKRLPELFPHKDTRPYYEGKPAFAEETAFRNSSLQGAYLMLGARALGYDVGPMSGFDQAKVNEAFFAGTTTRVNFLCNIGRGDPTKLWPRLPRPAFDDVCRLA
jgi:3-hydroxypropanoate dehydrogenase